MAESSRLQRLVRVAVIVLLIGIAAWIGWSTVGVVGPKVTPHQPNPVDPAASAAMRDAPGAPAFGSVGPATTPASDSEAWRSALARAYAAAGVAQDGSGVTLPPLDELARSLLPDAERLLAAAPVRSGPGLPTTIPTGSMGQRAPAPLLERSRDAPRFVDAPDGIPSDRIANTLAATSLPENTGEVYIKTRNGPVFVKPGQWADIELEPAAHALTGLRIANTSAGEYGIAIDAADFSSIRLNGALVVPGRFYRVRQGGVLINGQIKAHITIRPVSALPVYVEAPTAFPPAAG